MYDKRKNFLYIGQKLPSLNEYVSKNRAHPQVGARFKREADETIRMWVNACVAQGDLHPISSPCEIVIDFYEGNNRRDVDNVQSATKYILDALQEAGILPNDNQKWVKQIFHRVLHNVAGACVYVYLIEDAHIALTVQENDS